jgi:hypothetical protein
MHQSRKFLLGVIVVMAKLGTGTNVTKPTTDMFIAPTASQK